MANIIIINPRFEPSYWGLEHALDLLGVKSNVPVAALPLLAALTPPGHKVTLIDECVEEIDYDLCAKADIIGVTGMIVQRHRMMEIVQELKRRGCYVAIGGPWVTVQEDYFGDLADVIFVGEAEDTWPQFLFDWQKGTVPKRYEQAVKTDMSKVPVPRHDLLKMERYALASLQISRGCPFTCEFCDIIVTFGRRPRLKTSAQIIAELDSLWFQHNCETVFIVDDNLIGNKKLIKAHLRDIIKWQEKNDYPMMFLTEASLDLADDREMMDLMVAANIRILFVGIETPNEESLRETGKLQNLRKGGTIVEKVRMIQDAGMEVTSGHILGFDADGPDIFDRQLMFIKQARIVNGMVGMLSAIPKTPLHARLKKDGRLDPSDRPEFGTNVIPTQLGRAQLHEGYVRVMNELYEPAAYFGRLDDLYFTGGLDQSAPQHRHMRRKPLKRLARGAALLAEAAYISLRLQWGVRDKGLRRHYRAAMGRVLRKRPRPDILQAYAVKCAMHYHTHKLVAQMTGEGSMVNTF